MKRGGGEQMVIPMRERYPPARQGDRCECCQFCVEVLVERRVYEAGVYVYKKVPRPGCRFGEAVQNAQYGVTCLYWREKA